MNIRPTTGAYHRKVKRLRERLRLKQGNICPFCGVEMTTPNGTPPIGTDVTLEHVRPLSLGGRLNDDDCVAACFDCNDQRNRVMQALEKVAA